MTWLAPLAVAGLVMLPRLTSPQFGLLDDGLTLQTGREVIGRWSTVLHLIPETGRFFPAYWLVYSAIFGVVGARPLGFFAVNVALLAGLLAVLVRLVRSSGGTPRQAAVAVVLFASCGPTIESFYTLSKAEPLQLAWIAGSLLATAAALGAVGARRAGLLVVAAGALLLAHATKETSLVLVPISLGWLAVERWSSREPGPFPRFAVTYLAINLVAAAAFVVLRWSYAPLAVAEGTYTRAYTLHPGVVGPALFRISAWLVRDFAFLLPLLLFAVLSPRGDGSPARRLIGYASVWMVGWLAVFLPWPATFEYYLLPFAFGAAALAGAVVGDLWAARGRPHPATSRIAWGVLMTSGALWLVAVANATADARVQLTVDRSNADLIDFLADLPSGSRIVLDTALNEYVAEVPMHLSQIKGRPDLVVEHVTRASGDRPTSADVFVVTAEVANRPWPTVRVAPHQPLAGRDPATSSELRTGRRDPVYRAARRTRLTEIGIHRLLCRVAVSPFVEPGYCPGDGDVLDWRVFSYGWRVDRLKGAQRDG